MNDLSRAAVLLLSFCSALALASCRQSPGEPTSIRVTNGGLVDFESVIVEFPEQTEDYGALQAGQVSEYRPISVAYRYAYVEVRFSGGRAVLQPIDYVGEVPLNGGRFTYRLTLTSPTALPPIVNLEFIDD